MANEIKVRIFEGDEGFFIARAVGYPGVSAYGKTQEQAIEGIKDAWMCMNNFNAVKNMGNSAGFSSGKQAKEINLPLQFA